ncbi:hypothetical protein CBM2598_U10028 [Cupriavidus taiwanensis]|nr:hypothetical protein CBM2598_U10028 [Cupriavidus taiwanensis]
MKRSIAQPRLEEHQLQLRSIYGPGKLRITIGLRLSAKRSFKPRRANGREVVLSHLIRADKAPRHLHN